jgi:hypothetical protein
VPSQQYLTDTTPALKLISHDHHHPFRPSWTRATQPKSSARAGVGALPGFAVVTLVISVVILGM